MHVHQVLPGEVDLSGRACALDYDQIVLRTEAMQRVGDYPDELGFELLVLGPGHPAKRLAEHDHLRAHPALGLQQDRIHLDARLNAGSLRLHGLGTPNLAAVGCDKRVERHVLRLERRDAQPFAMKYSTECGDDEGLADRRRGALHH